MIHETCPCCDVSKLPHAGDCTFSDDCPDECADFDYVAGIRAERDDAIRESRMLKSGRRPIAWLCRDSDGTRTIYPVAPCRTRKEAMAITEAQGYAIDPIPIYRE